MSQRELKITASVVGASAAASELGQMEDRIKSIKDLGSAMTSKGKDLMKFGAKATLATAPIAMALKRGTGIATEIDTVSRKVSTLADSQIMPVDKIKAEMREISDAAGRTQAEVGEAMYTALSSGVDTGMVSEFASSAINLTKAGFTDMQTAIDATTTVMNAYGKESENVSKIHDIFVKTQDLGKIEVGELASNIGRVIPTAAAAGVGLDQLGTSYSILTAKGQAPTIATTNLNRMLVELSSTGSKADKVLRGKTGKSFKELTSEGKNLGDVLEVLDEEAQSTGVSMQDMFGSINAAQAAQSLLSEGAEGYAKTLKEIQESDGVTVENAKAMEGPEEAMKRMRVNIDNILGDLGAAFLPILADVAEAVSVITGKLGEMDSSTIESIAQWGALAIAVGPVVGILGGVVTAIGGVISVVGGIAGAIGSFVGFIAPAIGAIGGAFSTLAGFINLPVIVVGALIAIGATLIGNWDEVKAKAEELGGGLRGYLVGAISVVTSKFSALGGIATGALNGIKSAWESLRSAVSKPITAIVNVGRKVFGGGKPDGSHSTGLDYVPRDGYVGELHKGEMVLPRKTAEMYRQSGGDIDNLPVIKDYRTAGSTSTITYSVGDVIVTVQGHADKDTANDIGVTVRREVESIFKKLNLQRG